MGMAIIIILVRDVFREKCNFSELESIVFEQRSKGRTLQEIADTYSISLDYVRKLSQKVNKKIIKVL